MSEQTNITETASATDERPPGVRDPDMDFVAEVAHIKHTVPGICLLTLRLEVRDHDFSYIPGQYVWIKFGTFAPRPYSVAGRPAADTIEIHIKDSGTGGASSYVLKKLKPGQHVKLSAPEGISVFPPDAGVQNLSEKRLILIGGGLGIVPLKAIAETALEAGHPVDLLWGAAHEDELYLETYFQDLAASADGFSYRSMTKDPVTASIPEAYDDLSGFLIYLGGPPAMIEAAVPVLLEAGADSDHIYYDRL